MQKHDQYLISKEYYHKIIRYASEADYKFFKSHISALLLMSACVVINTIVLLIADSFQTEQILTMNAIMVAVLISAWIFLIKLFPFKKFLKERQEEFEKAVFDSEVQYEINKLTGDENA